jgi:multicomponent Na+:H+ antiporter subunit E
MIGRLAAFAWLLLIWVTLLGGVSMAGAIIGGMLSAALLTYFRPLHATGQVLAFRPLHVARFIGYFAVRFVQANIQVALAVIQPARIRHSRAIVAVPIVGASELTTLVLANAVCLTPGTFVVETRHEPPVLYVHALQVTTARALRLDLLDMERLIVLAVGPPGAAAAVDELRAQVRDDQADEGRHASWKPPR